MLLAEQQLHALVLPSQSKERGLLGTVTRLIRKTTLLIGNFSFKSFKCFWDYHTGCNSWFDTAIRLIVGARDEGLTVVCTTDQPRLTFAVTVTVSLAFWTLVGGAATVPSIGAAITGWTFQREYLD